MKGIPLSLKTAAGAGAMLLAGAGWLAYGQENSAGTAKSRGTEFTSGELKSVTAARPATKPDAEDEADTDEESPEENGTAAKNETPDAADGKSGDQSGAADGKKAAGISLPSRERLDMMLPPGRTHTGVRFPEYVTLRPDPENIDPVTGAPAGVTAPMASLFETEVMTRLDADHVRMDRAVWQQFDEQGGSDDPKMKVELLRGIYDLKSGILMSNMPVRIENRVFQLDGNTMLHDRTTGLTRLTGNVVMRFYKTEEKERAPAAGASSAPAAAPIPEK